MKLALCVDLDGTLISEDLTTFACKEYIHDGSFLRIFLLVWWLTRGRAYCKSKLAKHVDFHPSELHYNEPFLNFLKKKKADGHKIFLATGCNEIYAKKVAEYLKIFDGVFASDNSVNLVGEYKALKLIENFGRHNFIYAGNSSSDIAVWGKSAEAILVTPTKSALKRMSGNKYILFE